MAKALTREDLLYILQSIFRLSEQENNAFQMLTDGLFVEDYHADLQAHMDDANVHVNATLKQILDDLSLTETGTLMYKDMPISLAISQKEGNSIAIELDGLYVPGVAQEAADHLVNNDVHVTADDKENWNNTLQQAKEFTKDEISKLVIHDIQIVEVLPEIPVVIEDTGSGDDIPSEEGEVAQPVFPSSTTLYLVVNDPDTPEENLFAMYMYLQDQWVRLNISKQTLGKYVLKTEVEDAIKNSHAHENEEALSKLSTDENGNLLYNGTNIHDVDLSTEAGNAAKMIDGKLYVEDLKDELKSLETAAAFAKVNLYSEEINNSGVYELKDYIDNYNLILVEYYYRPNDENEAPGCAKTAVIDTDILNYLYTKNMDYMLEYGYGILMSNSKIRMHGDKLWVDYYHNVCIYRITGIRRGDSNE
jgi:hypothetical protein